MRVGVLGIGIFLPDEIRKNDWWPEETVEDWRLMRTVARHEPKSESEALLRAAQDALADDPFKGAVERRVMPSSMRAIDMEIAAARDALDRAGVDKDEIGFVAVQSTIMDYAATNVACSVHAGLDLPTDCFTMTLEAACNGFQQQCTLARAMIAGGDARYGLLIQSSSLSRVLPYQMPYSAWLGDGATAVVVGPTSADRGILGASHKTEGALDNTVLVNVPGGHWYDTARPIVCTESPESVHAMLMGIPDSAKSTITQALSRAGLSPEDVDFYAAHQAFPWYRSVTQTYSGLNHARSVDTFAWAGSLAAANIPLVLATAERQGLLKPDDIVVTQTGGSGLTHASLVIRWGR